MSIVDAEQLLHSIQIAEKNWTDWTAEFEHSGPVKTHPLLAEPGLRFNAFCNEYSIRRNIRAGKRDAFRRQLREDLTDVIRDDSGGGIDVLEQHLRSAFGAKRPGAHACTLLAAVSTVAAFMKPERFVACTSYAKKGLNKERQPDRGPTARFATYNEYLATFNAVWEGRLGREIRHVTEDREAPQCEPRFQRRVLDVYLMKRGGRIFNLDR